MARQAKLSVAGFLHELAELMEPIEQLDPTDLLFKKFEGPDFAKINSVKKQEPGSQFFSLLFVETRSDSSHHNIVLFVRSGSCRVF